MTLSNIRNDGWLGTENDAMIWDDLSTLLNARADCGPKQRRLIKRRRLMAGREFAPAFARRVMPTPARA